MTDFKIGSHNWSGISKLVEEAGEVMQVCGKLIGTGGKLEHWDNGPNLKDRLEDELADLLAAIDFVSKINHLDQEKINDRVFAKYQLFLEWHKATRIKEDKHE
jgi:NTP pyrophosphatase (non-canonical NTP hydrolase)